MLSRERITTLLGGFSRLRIALLGDLFLDRYLELVPRLHELSIETGLEAYQIATVRNAPGALGTVMNNLAALGVGQLVPLTVIGDDGHGYDLQQQVKKLPTNLQWLVTDVQRLTPTYTKPMRWNESGEWRELNRIDVRSRGPIGKATQDRLLANVEDAFRSSDGLIVLDQINETDWGVVNHSVRAALAELSRRHPQKLIYVDSRRHLGEFTFGVLKGNRAEILNAAHVAGESDDAVIDAIGKLTARTGQPVFCTASERGIWVADSSHKPELVPGCPVSGPVDIVGAGDAATSGIVLSLLGGASLQEAAMMGNLVASITVQQLGTTGTATQQQVADRWGEVYRPVER